MNSLEGQYPIIRNKDFSDDQHLVKGFLEENFLLLVNYKSIDDDSHFYSLLQD